MTKGDKLAKEYHESTPESEQVKKCLEKKGFPSNYAQIWSKPGALIPVNGHLQSNHPLHHALVLSGAMMGKKSGESN
jgi:hypothetical protein